MRVHTIGLALLFLAIPVRAQIIEVSAGSSTLYQASGASVTLHFPDSTSTVSGGLINGHFRFGASEGFRFHGYDVTAGDSYLGLTAANSALAVPTRGIAATRRKLPVCNRQPIPAMRWTRPPIWGVIPCTPTTILTVFLGTTGAAYTTPFFSSGSLQHVSAGMRAEIEMRAVTFSTLNVISGNLKTSLWGIDAHGHGIKVNLGGGLLQNAGYWNADGSFQPSRHVLVDAAHSTYVFAGQRAEVNSISAAALMGRIDAHGSLLLGKGEVAGLGVNLAPFHFSIDRFQMRAGTQTFGTVSERIGRHWTFSEYITRRSPSAGFEYVSNRFSAGIGYTALLFPFQRVAIQRTLSAHLSIRVHDAIISLAGLIPPQGKALYSVGGQDYFSGPYSGGDTARRFSSSGKYEVHGIVLDTDGQAVSGAALNIGGQIVYSDSDGAFMARVKRNRAVPVSVSLDDFSAPGSWAVVSSPSSATPSDAVKVTVRRAQ